MSTYDSRVMAMVQQPLKRIQSITSTVSFDEDTLDSSTSISEESGLGPLRLVAGKSITIAPKIHTLIIIADSSLLGDPLARVHAHSALAVTPGNEIMVRTLHRSLQDCGEVFVHEQSGKTIWLVSPTNNSTPLRDTHAAGREIHIFPKFELPPADCRFREDPVCRAIFCRGLLSDEDTRLIREYFPGSVGARVLTCGFLVILFDHKKALKKSWQQGVVNYVGGLAVKYAIRDCMTACDVIPSRPASINRPDGLVENSCLGLRLRLENGIEAITTVTHSFVKFPTGPSATRARLLAWTGSICSALARFCLTRRTNSKPALAQRERRRCNTSLGQEVWMDETSDKVGTITRTYDPSPISTVLPFPSGFRHDLSLITGENLPQITNPPNCPLITGWGPYSAVLEGAALFTCGMNVVSNTETNLEAQSAMKKAVHAAALATGAEYFWNRKSVCPQSTAILWRTAFNLDRPTQAGSGSVLCLGKITDPTAQAVVFQNFDVAIKTRLQVEEGQKGKPHQGLHPNYTRFQAGYLLPEDIRRSEIQMPRPISIPIPTIRPRGGHFFNREKVHDVVNDGQGQDKGDDWGDMW